MNACVRGWGCVGGVIWAGVATVPGQNFCPSPPLVSLNGTFSVVLATGLNRAPAGSMDQSLECYFWVFHRDPTVSSHDALLTWN